MYTLAREAGWNAWDLERVVLRSLGVDRVEDLSREDRDRVGASLWMDVWFRFDVQRGCYYNPQHPDWDVPW